ncbi:MAG TPA: hypothetical protein VFX58_15560, partial [Chitinophagaceae bacterium]|nr:hypothetical protein [Chitinophagaceae bacterium]
YIYALKGIAWIAYSRDHDAAEASRILHYILSQTKMPELWLQLAEIKDWEGSLKEKISYQEKFLLELSKPAYGGMYNKYLLDLYAGEMHELDKALTIAWQEVKQRPTPETYDWLAWVYFLKGELDEAWRLNQNYVAGKNFEPDAIYHSALICQAKGKKKEARKMLEECLESSFELGPKTTAEIKSKLAVFDQVH